MESTDSIETQLLRYTGADDISHSEPVQSLWSGYGEIRRYGLHFSSEQAKGPPSVIVKHVQIPDDVAHPRGWNTSRSHQRKLRSYRVESNWYQHYAAICSAACRVPNLLFTETYERGCIIVMEDLNTSGFSERREQASLQDMHKCLHWLANFHATFMMKAPDDLWPLGTYWHLDTRPDEWAVLEDQALKDSASVIDKALRDCPYQSFVHGDAKLANFCFTKQGEEVAAVDFQYVGGGCGMKDLAYFVGSCLAEDECKNHEMDLLDAYFIALEQALTEQKSVITGSEVEQAWRPLFKYAWADFHRFLKGWSPGHWKINTYSERLTREVLDEINGS